jgi:hypothetical protein
MAHFAELDDQNIVLQVIVVSDNDCIDANGNESEDVGIQFCTNLLGGRWIQTSYNARIRKNFASVGAHYIEQHDGFAGVQPYPSWVLNIDTCKWEAPVAQPELDGSWVWHEEEQKWTR